MCDYLGKLHVGNNFNVLIVFFRVSIDNKQLKFLQIIVALLTWSMLIPWRS